MEYTIVKWLHIVASTFLFGTGVGSAFYFLFASLQRDPVVIAFVARHVVIADWLFTATTMLVQPVSGLYLAHLAHWPLSSGWLRWSIALYMLAGLCWLPVIVIQMRMRDIAVSASAAGSALPPQFWRYFASWVLLGIPAFFSFLIIFYLMVAKPAAI